MRNVFSVYEVCNLLSGTNKLSVYTYNVLCIHLLVLLPPVLDVDDRGELGPEPLEWFPLVTTFFDHLLNGQTEGNLYIHYSKKLFFPLVEFCIDCTNRETRLVFSKLARNFHYGQLLVLNACRRNCTCSCKYMYV